MIIKGSSRAGPEQLARHLKRTDTNERVELLELQWGHPDIGEAFRDWQALAAVTRGNKGLYHANIDPAAMYAMTPEQWTRSVDVLERELGLEGQPRAVMLHEKHGRQHVHVVWARTDIDTMTMRSDSQNFAAHERASNQLEQEFGHEHVPGKHEKRDRDRQDEPPRAEITHDEWQQAERTGIDPRTRKSQVTALFGQCDNGAAFKAALEDMGYVLAHGDRRDIVLVDEHGEVHSLGRQIKNVKAKDLRAFMADVPLTGLPSIEEARVQQTAKIAPAVEEPQNTQEATELAPLAPEEEARLRAQLAAHYADEREALRISQAYTRTQHAVADRAALEEAAAVPIPEPEAPRSSFVLLWQNVREFFSPDLRRAREEGEAREAAAIAAEREKVRLEEIAALERQQAIERKHTEERHEAEMHALEASQADDLARRLHEAREAIRIAREIDREHQRAAKLEQGFDATQRGPPRAG